MTALADLAVTVAPLCPVLHLVARVILQKKKKRSQGFPCGSVDKNPPANVGDTVQEDPTCSRTTKPVHHNH